MHFSSSGSRDIHYLRPIDFSFVAEFNMDDEAAKRSARSLLHHSHNQQHHISLTRKPVNTQSKQHIMIIINTTRHDTTRRLPIFII